MLLSKPTPQNALELARTVQSPPVDIADTVDVATAVQLELGFGHLVEKPATEYAFFQGGERTAD